MQYKIKSNFIKNIILLAGGTASAQLINILCFPLLTRIYSPEDFGIYTITIAINTVITVFCTCKYENAIITVQTDIRARLVVIMMFALILINASIILFFTLLLMHFIDHNVKHVTSIIISIYLSSVFSSLYQVVYFWNNRHSSYSIMSKGRLFSVASMMLFSVFYGYFFGDIKGLLYGNVINLCVNFLYLLFFGKKILTNNKIIKPQYLVMVAKKLIRFPKYLVWSSILDRTSSQMHLFLFNHFYGAAVSGAIGLHNRVISLPSSIIGTAIGDVFKRQASENIKIEGQCYYLFLKTAVLLFLLASPIAIILMLFAPELFAFVFGDNWRSAGKISQILACNFWIGFVVSPLSNLIYLEKNQHYDFYLQLFLICMLITSMGYAIIYLNMIMAVWAFTGSYIIKYIVEFIICLKISLGKKSKNN